MKDLNSKIPMPKLNVVAEKVSTSRQQCDDTLDVHVVDPLQKIL